MNISNSLSPNTLGNISASAAQSAGSSPDDAPSAGAGRPATGNSPYDRVGYRRGVALALTNVPAADLRQDNLLLRMRALRV